MLGAGNIVPFIFLNLGCIVAPSSQTNQTPVNGAVSPPSPYSPPNVVNETCLCTISTTYQVRPQLYRADGDQVYQGSWNLTNQIGMMFFNGNPNFANIRANATTILSARLFVRRSAIGGLAGNRNLHLYGINIVSPREPVDFRMFSLIWVSGNVAMLMWGEEVVINLPSEFFGHVLSGLVRGFAIYDESGEPFIRLDGIEDYQIKCEFTYI